MVGSVVNQNVRAAGAEAVIVAVVLEVEVAIVMEGAEQEGGALALANQQLSHLNSLNQATKLGLRANLLKFGSMIRLEFQLKNRWWCGR